MGTRLFIGNVSPDSTKTGLQEFFAELGEVVDVAIPVDRDSGQPRGFAFVEFATEEEAAEAMESLQHAELDGRRLRLRPAYEEKRRDGSGRQRERSARLDDVEDDDRLADDDRREPHDDWDERRERRPRGGKHGSDRRRSHGTRRRID